jgi:hypothetical protein
MAADGDVDGPTLSTQRARGSHCAVNARAHIVVHPEDVKPEVEPSRQRITLWYESSGTEAGPCSQDRLSLPGEWLL